MQYMLYLFLNDCIRSRKCLAATSVPVRAVRNAMDIILFSLLDALHFDSGNVFTKLMDSTFFLSLS